MQKTHTKSAIPPDNPTIFTVPSAPPGVLAQDETFWKRVRAEYNPPEDFIHLEYGWYHPCANRVLAREIEAMKAGQRRGSHYKRGEMKADREAARADLAALAGVTTEEVIVTRNTTESLNIVIQGMPLTRGDGIVHCDQEYPGVLETLEQRAQRDGLELQRVCLPLHPRSDDEIVAAYAASIRPNTRAILVNHVINLTGQLLPAGKLCALGRRHGLQVIVDAAHAFAQVNVPLKDLDCDYYAASLHKWLGAPLGTGLLYVRRDRIEALAPFFADTGIPRTNIRKLEHSGNGPDSLHIGLREAIRWHSVLGTAVKEARLRLLQRRWTEAARNLPGLRVLTPEPPERHGAVGTFAIDGLRPETVVSTLMERYNIFVNAVTHPVISGVRVTPGLPTSLEEIDALVAALHALSGKGRIA